MRLPRWEHVVLAGDRQHVLRHGGSEALKMPFLRAVEAELTIEAAFVDLWRHVQKNHPGETATVGVHGVVITRPLAIQPEIDHLQVVAAWNPGTPSLGRLTLHHVPDPAIAGRQKMLPAQLLDPLLIWEQLTLLRKLSGELG